VSRPGSDSGAVNSTPLTTPTAEQAPERTELSSADALAGAGLDEDPPFGDWREQLRDRVKEIRARKLVDKRPREGAAGALSQPADAARSEKIQAARDHAAIMTHDPAPSSPLEPATESADLTNLMDVLLNPPEGLQPLIEPSPPATEQDDEGPAEWEASASLPTLDEIPTETPAGVTDTAMADSEPAEAAQVMSVSEVDLTHLDDEDIEETSPSESLLEIAEPEDVPDFGDTAPLFQDEPRLIEDNPLNEIVEETPEEQPPEPNADRQTPPPLDGFRTEMPDWAKVQGPIESAAPTPQRPPPPDLDAIPTELADVAIPAWALPRQRDDQAAGAFAAGAPGQLNADALLAGDPLDRLPAAGEISTQSKVEATTDDRLPATSGPGGREASIEPEGFVQHDVHIVSEYVARASSAQRSTFEDLPKETQPPDTDDPPAPTRISAPNAEPQAITPEPVGALEPDVPTAEAPSSFEPLLDPSPESPLEEPAAASSQADSEDPSSRRFPGLFDPAGMPSPETEALIDAETSAAEASATEPEPQSAMDTAMEWDLEAPSDPDTILDVQRDPMDPTAPMSDRLFSALADGLVLTTIALLLMFGGASAAGTGMLSFVSAAPVPFAVAWLIFGLSYGIFFVGTCGQTLGKMAMRIRVIGSSSFHVGYARATVRAMSYTVAMLPVGLGLLLALRDLEHRALHDRLSGTRVVKA
jgi:uncharacterized RDD family membrane protein YckC